MDAVIPPIVIDGDGEFEVYPTVNAACQAVEVYDIDLYEVFDSAGRQLMFIARGTSVELMERATSRPEPTELARRLRRFLSTIDLAPPPPHLTWARVPPQRMLDALVSYQQADQARTRFTWRRNRSKHS